MGPRGWVGDQRKARSKDSHDLDIVVRRRIGVL